MFTPRLAVLGAGLMGVGIACHFARHGHAVRLYDTDPRVSPRFRQWPAPSCASWRPAVNRIPPTATRCWPV
ncbi:3-hydroxyacyl-CoA dehydrogenase NAD-binding domain-containing protein [Klebsiella pneumoniae]|nr:3-hydroxyacyl-CoA dehydrogenase NAD-binding domain-containing protein [Klebsiella pneumoniae]